MLVPLLIAAVLTSASPRRPPEPTPIAHETQRVRSHLEAVILLLRARSPSVVDPRKRAARDVLIDRLAAYTKAGAFPQNHLYPGKRPVFIDAHGNLCAVGFLVSETLGRAEAERIASAYRYAFLRAMDDPAIGAWADHHGFTVTELAMIQPSYHWERPIRPDPIVPIVYVPFAGWSPVHALPAQVFAQLDAGNGATTDAEYGYRKTIIDGQTIVVRVDRDRNVVGIAQGRGARLAWRGYYPTGELAATGTYQGGKPIGRWVFYDAAGKVLAVGRYVRDELVLDRG